jgi:hypothetical protein
MWLILDLGKLLKLRFIPFWNKAENYQVQTVFNWEIRKSPKEKCSTGKLENPDMYKF